jgi:hypothetical protein
MSEQMPEITEEEARILEELAELEESDPAGYQALIEDLGEEDKDALARAHGEQLLQIFDARFQERDKDLIELLNHAYRPDAERDTQ